MKYKSTIFSVLFVSFTTLFAFSAHARGSSSGGGDREENYMVSNGQGVSSPSFQSGMEGENPAGLAWNQRLKVQGDVASFDNSSNNLRGSGGLLVGNGLIGAGVEYGTYDSDPYPKGTALVNYGLAAKLAPLNTTVGVSGHSLTGNETGSFYDVGVLISPIQSVRIGAMVPDFTHGLHVVAAGLTYMLDAAADFVVDGAYRIQGRDTMVKPGLTIRADMLQATAAYGFHANGVDDVFLYHGFTGGLGLRLTDSVLIEYEYRGIPQHRVGLTLRLN